MLVFCCIFSSDLNNLINKIKKYKEKIITSVKQMQKKVFLYHIFAVNLNLMKTWWYDISCYEVEKNMLWCLKIIMLDFYKDDEKS